MDVSQQSDTGPIRGASLAPAAALMAFGLAWTVALAVWPRSDHPLAAIFPPTLAGSHALAAAVAAGAEEVLTFGGWPAVVIVRSTTPNVIERLYRAGALVVLRAPERSDCMR